MPTMPTILEIPLFQRLPLVMVMGRDHAPHHAHHAHGVIRNLLKVKKTAVGRTALQSLQETLATIG